MVIATKAYNEEAFNPVTLRDKKEDNNVYY